MTKEGIFYPTEEPEVTPFIRLKEEFLHKSIYFYLSSDSYLLNVGFFLSPDGYCERSAYREMESFMGRPVVDAEAIMERPDVLIVLRESSDKEILKGKISEDALILYADLFETDRELTGGRVFQGWGTEEEWSVFRRIVGDVRMPYRNYVDKGDVDGVLLWEGSRERTPEKFREYMKQVNPNVDLYAGNFVFETNGFESMSFFCCNLDRALMEKRTCILYGTRSHYTSHWIQILERMRLPFLLMEEEEGEWYGYPVACIYDIPFYDRDKLLLICNSPYGELPRARALLHDYGIALERFNCISMYEELLQQDRGGTMADVCAGWVSEKQGRSDTPCYQTIGERRDQDYKIMIVGGSTSAGCLYQYRSWPEILHAMLEEEGKCVTIYNGAVEGYYSMQELAKVIRDSRILKPDLIISFSGVNDSGLMMPENGYWCNGMYRNDAEDKFRHWIENERFMAYAAEQVHARFFCFAQPQFHLHTHLDRYGKLLTASKRCFRKKYVDLNWREEIRNLKEQAGYAWLVDLSDILEDHPEVYFDDCHVASEGNRIIAGYIYAHIKGCIR